GSGVLATLFICFLSSPCAFHADPLPYLCWRTSAVGNAAILPPPLARLRGEDGRRGAAGLPTTVVCGGTLFVTTAPMPTMAPSPMSILRPFMLCWMMARVPIYAWFSITTPPLQQTRGAKVT